MDCEIIGYVTRKDLISRVGSHIELSGEYIVGIEFAQRRGLCSLK